MRAVRSAQCEARRLRPASHWALRTSHCAWRVLQHTLIGARLLRDSASELLRAGEIIVRSHHEKWDGSGYPNGLKGEAIPLYGRICAVADVFDALTTRRPYKEALSNEAAYAILRSGRGSHFDPRILDLFFAHLDEIVEIQEQYREER